MVSSTIDSQYLSLLSDIQKAMFHQLNLSDEQQALVSEYYQLSTQINLSQADLYQLGCIWRRAEKDKQLTQALVLIDDLKSECLKDDVLLSDDRDLRAHLSEHIPVLAEENFKRFRGMQEELNPQKSFITMLCPDGSGIVQINLDEGRFISLDDIYQQVCERCNATFAEHERLMFFSGESVSLPKSGA